MTGFLVVLAISALTTAGAVVLTRRGRGASGTSVAAPGLAAGVMVWLALAEVAPDGVATLGLPRTVAAMGAGAALVVTVARLAHRSTVAAGVAPVIGVALILHDLPEGFAVGAVVGSAGLAVALPTIVAVAAHNLPEKLAFLGPAEAESVPRAPVLLAATVPEPVGAALARVGSALLPGAADVALAVAGGMMLAVAIGTLPVLARRADALRPFLAAGVTGGAGMAALGLLLPG